MINKKLELENKRRQKRVLILALLAGEIILKAGAEIYRVEDTITRICKACKVPFIEVYVVTTGIFLSLDAGLKEHTVHTFIKRIKNIDINLEKISLVNDFSRKFTKTSLSIDEGFEILRNIRNTKSYSKPLLFFCVLLVGCFISLRYSASYFEMLFSGVASLGGFLLYFYTKKLAIGNFIRIYLGSFLCIAISIIFSLIFPNTNVHPMIVASLTVFMPGVAITNAARDILSGDMLSGTSRIVEVITIAISIALGVVSVLEICNVFNLTFLDLNTTIEYPIYFKMIAAIFFSFGIGVIFNSPKKTLIAIVVISSLTEYLFNFLVSLEFNAIIATLIGAIFIGLASEVCSRAGREATTIFIIPCIIPLVPGANLYEAMYYVISQDFSMALEKVVESFFMAGAIAIGIMFTATLTRIVNIGINKIVSKS